MTAEELKNLDYQHWVKETNFSCPKVYKDEVEFMKDGKLVRESKSKFNQSPVLVSVFV